ncbi:hypothetical protein HOLleu_20314 [Holothuria leucospilota]|uniref:Uncharacterized protein n=1 Tax=Holothuria leucospilota TaxID=206669 RepID=A0A9Q1BZN8_HOLLE|nr:hypothetical protein HOLleu_20314 [Holothuria leucospilota]
MGSLYKFSLEQLKTVYEALTLGQKSDAVTTWGVIKSITQFLDREETAQRKTNLETLEKSLRGLTPTEGTTPDSEETKTDQAKTPSPTGPNIQLKDLAEALKKKDFKIQGQIGEPGHKGELIFPSLATQIEQGLKKGHEETEIVAGVVKAISYGLPLRAYLEGRPKITLPQLRKVLRAHYKERGSVELYQELVSAAQLPQETSYDFIIRAMDLRQKVLFASQEDKSTLQYDTRLVQDTFFQTLMTGLEEFVRIYLQPDLEDPNTSDEVLLEKLTVAVARNQVRQKKRLLSGVPVEVLWDTGAEVFLVSLGWWKSHLPTTPLRSLSELLETDLKLEMANGSPLPYLGWVEIQVTLSPEQSLSVPFLVTPDYLSEPIIGCNVIEEFLHNARGSDSANVNVTMTAIFSKLQSHKITKLMSIIESNEPDHLCTVKVGRLNVVVPPCQTIGVRCSIYMGPVPEQMTTLFEPDLEQPWPSALTVHEAVVGVTKGSSGRVTIHVTNNSNKDVVLPKRTTLGHLQLVRSIFSSEHLQAESLGEVSTEREIGTQPSVGEISSITPMDTTSQEQEGWDPQCMWVCSLLNNNSELRTC